MGASFPTQTKSFSFRQNARDTVLAGDVNDAYYEISAIEDVLGANPHQSAAWSGSTFTTSASTYTWSSVAARIQNIENGVYKAVFGAVLTAGGSVLQPSGTGVVGVVLKGYNSGTDVLQAIPYNYTTGTIPTRIDRNGVTYSKGSEVATIGNAETLSNKTLSGATIDGGANSLTNISTSSVIVTGTTNIKTYVDAKPDVFIQSSTPSSPTIGDIWVDTGSTVTPFDSSNFIQYSAPSLTTQNGSMGAGTAGGWHRIIASTSAPTGTDGANGDVWLQFI